MQRRALMATGLGAAVAAATRTVSATPLKQAAPRIPETSIHRVKADGVDVFYRAAGPENGPVVLLLHGFPTSSFQYRELIPRRSGLCPGTLPERWEGPSCNLRLPAG